MSGSLKSRNRNATTSAEPSTAVDDGHGSEAVSDLEVYAQEVLDALIEDSLPPTPNNFSLYFDRLLEDKSENLRMQVHSMLELEESNDDENSIMLEQSLKQGFSSVKNILGVTASLYKNMNLMTKILEKRKNDLVGNKDVQSAASVANLLENDITKLNAIVKKQSVQMKTIYEDTAKIVKTVDSETIFDNKYGVYNKRYLLTKIGQEQELIKEFKHSSSLIMIELSKTLSESDGVNEKAIALMNGAIARLLLKTSRRSDVVAHFGGGTFSMLLKHTDIESAKKASERLCYLVSNSNFFLADREIQLKISIGITDVSFESTDNEIVVSAMDGILMAEADTEIDYAVSLRK